MSINEKEKLVGKLFAGKCSKGELMLLLELLRSDPNAADSKAMDRLWKELGKDNPLSSKQSDEIFEKTFRKISRRQQRRTPKLINWRLAAVAASIAALVAFGFWLNHRSNPFIEFQTAYAEQKAIELPDGSVVNLNANSTLRYRKHWNSYEDRQVELTGEAFFRVTQKPATGQKFCVRTKDLTVEVLGTRFNINAHRDQTEVFLEEGSIRLELNRHLEDIFLKPGELMSYSQKTKKPLKVAVTEEEPASWKDGFVWLRDKPLSEILQKVKDIYGLDFIISDEKQSNRQFTVGVPVNSFETMLDALREMTGLDIQRKGDLLEIKNSAE